MIGKKFYLTLVPTNECGLGCEYCYTIQNIKDKTKISLDNIIKIMNIISQERTNVEILFIGGEPTSVGYEYFSEIINILMNIKEKNNLKLNFVIQTNGTLLNEKWLKLFKKYDFRVGVSFDDFINSNVKHHRPQSNKTKKNIQLLKMNKINFSILSVFNNETINNLIDNYILMNKLKYDYKILPMNDNGYLEDKYIIKFDKETYEKIEKFVKKWLYDKFCAIKMRSFHSIFNTLFLEEIPLCNSCIENRVSIRPDGSLYPCGRPFENEYKVGHIDNITEFKQFQDNKGYKNLINLKIAKVSNCMGCKYFNICNGGCVSNNILDNSYTEANGFYCKYTTMVLDIFTPLVEEVKKDIKNGDISKYNPVLIDDLKIKGLM